MEVVARRKILSRYLAVSDAISLSQLPLHLVRQCYYTYLLRNTHGSREKCLNRPSESRTTPETIQMIAVGETLAPSSSSAPTEITIGPPIIPVHLVLRKDINLLLFDCCPC